MVKLNGKRAKFFESFGYAIRGALLPLEERNMRIHIGAALIAIAMGFLMKIDSTQWCLLAIVIGHVISKEVQNSAHEDLADACCPSFHPKVRDSKDKAAGAVLWAAFEALVVGGIIFLPK